MKITKYLSILIIVSKIASDDFYKNQDNKEWLSQNYENASCNGSRQSPIQITSKLVEKKCNAKKIKFDFTKELLNTIYNPSKAFLTPVNFGNLQLKDKNGQILNYEGLQMHLHSPAEHIVDNRVYDAEVHLVFKIKDEEMGLTGDTLVVLGFFFEIQNDEKNDFLEDWFLESFAKNSHNISDHMPSGFVLENFEKLFKDKNDTGILNNYMHYMGSLTTPTCDEIVNWFVFTDPISFNENQYNQIFGQFSKIENFHGKTLGNGNFGNNRGIQELNGRDVLFGNLQECWEADDAFVQDDVSLKSNEFII